MKQIFLQRIFFAVSITALCFISCKVSKRQTSNPPNPGTSCTATTTLEYSDSNCTTTGGCALTFSCPSITESGFQKFVELVADKFNLSSRLTAGTTPFVISSMTTVNTPAPLQAAPALVPKSWYSNATGAVTIDCTNDSGQINCPSFAPVGSQFNIVGTLGGSNVTVQVTVTNGITPVDNASNLTTGCGQFGTTYQRIFDCSERVTNFAGIGSYGEASSFVPDNPNANWYLVACPVFTGTNVGTDTTVQQCAWLSPVITPVTLPSPGINPVVGINHNSGATPTTDPTSPDFVSGVTRILWSGSLNNSDTNDYQNFGTIVGTDNTPSTSGGPYVNCYNPMGTGIGECADYETVVSSSPDTYTEMKSSISDGTTTTLGLLNICATQLLANDNAFSGMSATPYSWQVPSYPMLMTLTGGQNYCTAGVGTTGNCNAAGFSAISTPVPAFDNTMQNSTYLWSLSLNGNNNAWLFYGNGGSGVIGYFGLSGDPAAVRCASLAW